MNTQHAADEAFRAELLTVIPRLRAFARTLAGDATAADDLVQDALVNAWRARASYQPGTNLKSWTYRILRNQFYSDKRRSWRRVSLDMDVAERTLEAVSDPESVLELDEVRRAMALLPDEQREALMLIGVAGMPYEEAARLCDCAEGTIKSRVSRGRRRMLELLETGFIAEDGTRPSTAMACLLADAERLQVKTAA